MTLAYHFVLSRLILRYIVLREEQTVGLHKDYVAQRTRLWRIWKAYPEYTLPHNEFHVQRDGTEYGDVEEHWADQHDHSIAARRARLSLEHCCLERR